MRLQRYGRHLALNIAAVQLRDHRPFRNWSILGTSRNTYDFMTHRPKYEWVDVASRRPRSGRTASCPRSRAPRTSTLQARRDLFEILSSPCAAWWKRTF